MTKKYQIEEFDTSALAVPERGEGLLALAVGAGLQVMQQLMGADVAAACGPRAGTTQAGPRPGAQEQYWPPGDTSRSETSPETVDSRNWLPRLDSPNGSALRT